MIFLSHTSLSWNEIKVSFLHSLSKGLWLGTISFFSKQSCDKSNTYFSQPSFLHHVLEAIYLLLLMQICNMKMNCYIHLTIRCGSSKSFPKLYQISWKVLRKCRKKCNLQILLLWYQNRGTIYILTCFSSLTSSFLQSEYQKCFVHCVWMFAH